MKKTPQVLKNIIYIVAGVSGAIFGATLFDNGFIYAGGGIVLIFCGLYIAWHGLKGMIGGNKPGNEESMTENESKSSPKHPGKKKKKKKNSRK